MTDGTENVNIGTESEDEVVFTTPSTEDGNTVELRGIKSSTDENTYVSALAKNLHGRRPIFTNERFITRSNLLDVLNRSLDVHNRNRAEEEYLEKYLRGIQPILNRTKKYNSDINNQIVVNLANSIVTFKASEFAGEQIQYVSRGSREDIPEKVEKLNAMMLSEGKPSKDFDMAYRMFTCGVSYRLTLRDKAEAAAKAIETGELFDEAPFEIYTPDPRTTFVIRLNDVTKRVVAGVTYVFLDDARNQVEYTVYTENVTYRVKGTATRATQVVETTVHNFGMVTLVEYPCNTVFMGAFEPVLPLLDAYNTCMSNRLDGVEQFIQAMMVFDGYDITKETLDLAREMGAIKLPSTLDGRSGRGVYYLNEQLDQGQTQTLVDNIKQTILEIVGMPSQGNANTSDSSNNGAMIIKNGWWNAEARALETEGMWKQAETEFLKIVLKICKDANVLDGLSVSDVVPKFGRRSYEDKLTKTQSFTTLMSAGVPPIQAYAISGMVTDPEAAAIAYKAYQEEKEKELEDLPVIARNSQVNGVENETSLSSGNSAEDSGRDIGNGGAE